jgi:hypothetical protein
MIRFPATVDVARKRCHSFVNGSSAEVICSSPATPAACCA